MQRVKWKCNEEVVKFSWRVQEAFIEMLILKKKKNLNRRCSQLDVEIRKERGMKFQSDDAI